MRCTECGVRIVTPTWYDGKPYCLTCGIRKWAQDCIQEVRSRRELAKKK